VEGADRMLQAPSVEDHLGVIVERGKLVYALWEHRVPP
jgi:hypothetical protein